MKPIRMIAAALILVLSSITTFAMAASYSTDQSDLWWTDPPGYGRSSPILLKNSFSGATRKIPGPQRRRYFSDVWDYAIFYCARPSAF
jgi:hypothetical protein